MREVINRQTTLEDEPVYGAESLGGGALTINGKPYVPKCSSHAIKSGVYFVSEERKFDGFIPQMTGRDNVVLPILGRHVAAGILQWRKLRSSADEVLATVSIRGDTNAPITVEDYITAFRTGTCDGNVFKHDTATLTHLRELAWADANVTDGANEANA